MIILLNNLTKVQAINIELLFNSALTLLTACKAFLQASYCGESLAVFWQIVCKTWIHTGCIIKNTH